MKKNLYLFLLVFVGLAGFFLGRKNARIEKQIEYQTIRDTLVIKDTIEIIKPVVVKEYAKEVVVEKIPVELIAIEEDTAEIKLPFTTKIYQDSTYRAVVSGYKPSLDSLLLYQSKTVINNEIYIPKIEKQKPRWALGVQLGYGTDFQNFSPYIGIGVQYNIFSW